MATKKLDPTALAVRRRAIMAEIDKLTAEKAEIDAKLLTLDKSQQYIGDGVVLSFTPRRVLDSAFITKKFPPTKRPEFYKLSLDTAEFKKHFSPEELAAYQTISHIIKVTEE